jgi:alkanesulfonate monooxygenase SsuD/methylene tetrahydromethanopterin reductase-like flavin-dependent oxidoreductase (luciferase family)
MGAMAPGSVSMRIYPHNELGAPQIIDELIAQAMLAERHGFDGVMTSEHHGGFAGYLPNPLQVAGWMLEATTTLWAAACPMLLPLRPTALVAEEVAWLAARFADRVGIGVAAGALDDDFTIMGSTKDGLTDRFATGLQALAGMLSGSAPGMLQGDRAVAWCRAHPVPLVSAAMGLTASRRAAQCGVGLVLDSLSTPERCRELIDAYHDAGGLGPCVLIRRAWLGQPPRDELEQQVGVYRGYASTAAQSHWRGDELVHGDEPKAVGDAIVSLMKRTNADALNLRVHAPGVSAALAREQITILGDEVLPHLRRATGL